MGASSEHDPTVEILKESLRKRQTINTRYSIRAFARDLGMSPAFLSLVLNGKRRLSVEMVVKIGQRLGLNRSEERRFVKSALPGALPKKIGSLLSSFPSDGEEFEDLSADYFHTIADWYHLAILDFVTCANFRNDSEWISYKLGVPKPLVEEALSRLIRLNLIEQKGRRLEKSRNKIYITTSASKESIREHHRQMMHKALEELLKVSDRDFERRSISGMTLAINPKRLKAAYDKIEEFQKELANFLTQGECTEVYQFNQQFFPLSKAEVNS